MITPRSVKHRLALLYSGLFSGILLLTFFLIYRDLDHHLEKQTDSQITERARRNHWFAENVPTKTIQESISQNLRIEGSKKVFYILFSPESQVLAQSSLSSWAGLDINEDTVRRVRESFELKEGDLADAFPEMEVRRIGGKRFPNMIFLESGRTDNFPYRLGYIRFDGGRVLVSGQNVMWDAYFLNRLRSTFLILFASAVLVGGLLGYVLSHNAMKGVNRIRRTAQEISAGNLDLRVNVGNAGMEIENLASSFNGMVERIQALLNGLKQVTDDIAHDLRTPVTRIRSAAELAATESANPVYQQQMGVIVEECDGLIEMINTMLEIAQTDSGLITLQKDNLDLGEVVTAGFELFHSMAEDKNLDYDLDQPAEPIQLQGNRSRLQRAVANLLDNAIKFTPEGGRVDLRLRRNGAFATLEVEDTGPGIAPDDMAKIFDRFYRKDPSRNVEGYGLGLCLARSITRAHGGELLVDSELGKGSTFSLRLPLSSSS